ncbi:hypothetical protein RFI_17063, partial [Reticulomyxa filosa]
MGIVQVILSLIAGLMVVLLLTITYKISHVEDMIYIREESLLHAFCVLSAFIIYAVIAFSTAPLNKDNLRHGFRRRSLIRSILFSCLPCIPYYVVIFVGTSWVLNHNRKMYLAAVQSYSEMKRDANIIHPNQTLPTESTTGLGQPFSSSPLQVVTQHTSLGNPDPHTTLLLPSNVIVNVDPKTSANVSVDNTNASQTKQSTQISSSSETRNTAKNLLGKRSRPKVTLKHRFHFAFAPHISRQHYPMLHVIQDYNGFKIFMNHL